MTQTPSERPRQVTMVSWTIVVASVLLVLTVFDYIHGLRTLESRERIAAFLEEPPGDGLGISVPTAVELLKGLAMASAAAATAAAILAFQVMQRSHLARVILTVLAVPIFFLGMPSSGLISAVVAAAIVMLWMQPARAWFAGTPLPGAVAPGSPNPPGPSAPSAPAARTGEHPWPPVGGPPSPMDDVQPAYPPAGYPPAPQVVAGVNPYAAFPRAAAPARRPATLVWASVLTWVFSVMTVMSMGLVALVVATARDQVFDEVYRQSPELADAQMSRGELAVAIIIMAAILVVWAAAAILLAVLAFRGSNIARILLTVSATAAGLLMLVTVLSAPMMVIPVGACIATTVLLQRPEVRAFCSRVQAR